MFWKPTRKKDLKIRVSPLITAQFFDFRYFQNWLSYWPKNGLFSDSNKFSVLKPFSSLTFFIYELIWCFTCFNSVFHDGYFDIKVIIWPTIFSLAFIVTLINFIRIKTGFCPVIRTWEKTGFCPVIRTWKKNVFSQRCFHNQYVCYSGKSK